MLTGPVGCNGQDCAPGMGSLRPRFRNRQSRHSFLPSVLFSLQASISQRCNETNMQSNTPLPRSRDSEYSASVSWQGQSSTSVPRCPESGCRLPVWRWLRVTSWLQARPRVTPWVADAHRKSGRARAALAKPSTFLALLCAQQFWLRCGSGELRFPTCNLHYRWIKNASKWANARDIMWVFILSLHGKLFSKYSNVRHGKWTHTLGLIRCKFRFYVCWRNYSHVKWKLDIPEI